MTVFDCLGKLITKEQKHKILAIWGEWVKEGGMSCLPILHFLSGFWSYYGGIGLGPLPCAVCLLGKGGV